MPAIKANAALALNRELGGFEAWNETAIHARGAALFELARDIWLAPDRADLPGVGLMAVTGFAPLQSSFPPTGTACRFRYGGSEYNGAIVNGTLLVDGIEGKFRSFSAASRALTGTSRNGWNDWYLQDVDGEWRLAHDWRVGEIGG
jgi:hypothetical protein